MSRAGLQCPSCLRADNVQKVSAIVNAGTSYGTYTGYGSGVGYSSHDGMAIDEVVTFSGSSQTALSSLLSPPAQPTYSSSSGWLPLAPFGFGLLLLILLPEVPAIVWAVIIALCVWPSVALYRYTKRKNALNYAQFNDQMLPWQRAMAKWEDLFYCHRCDGVFLPGQSFFVPTIYMMDYLYDPYQ